MFFHRKTGKRVISIERREDCAEAARSLIAHMGYSGSLEVITRDGREYDYHMASLVVVAAMVSQKLEVAIRVRQTSKSSLLNVRTPVGLHSLCRTPIDEKDLNSTGWRVADFWLPQGSAVGAFTCNPLGAES
jgi:hypothetical protein